MDRVNGANTVDIGGGKRGFRDRNLVAGLAGTQVTAAHMNATQEEMLAVIEAAGITPADGDWDQLLEAIRKIAPSKLQRTVQGVGSGNFTVPAGVYRIQGSLTAGGGGGAGAGSGNAGGGGGAGETCFFSQAVTPGQVIAFVVPAGGTAGASGGGNGGNGGNASFGGITANGGAGGAVVTGGGVGGTGGAGGDLAVTGGDGDDGAGAASDIFGGQGGASSWGGGGRGGAAAGGGGRDGGAPGSGGGGCYAGAGTGGSGADGLLVVEY